MIHDKPDDGSSFSSGSGVWFAGRLNKPDAANGLKDRIGRDLLLPASGSSGQVAGVRAYEVEAQPLSRKHLQFIVMSVIIVIEARKRRT
jgi:hypothetical protein